VSAIPRLWVPVLGGRVKRSPGTRDKIVVRRMRAMLDALGPSGAQAWDVLEAVEANRWTLSDLYAAWEQADHKVGALRAILGDRPLDALVEPYLATIARDVAPETVERYRVHLGTMVRQIPTRSQFTVPKVEAWLTSLPVSGGTVRRYAAAASGFARWLVRQGLLPQNPVREVPKPSPAAPRDRWLTTADAMRLADAQPEPYRTFSAVLSGTGLDVSVALGLTRRMVDLSAWTITSVRPKTGIPHLVLIAEWARPYIQTHIKKLLPDAKLFPMDRWMCEKRHKAALKALGIENLTMRDARHTWAVRWAQAGGSAATGAAQLGHSDGGVLFLRVYGRHYPPLVDRMRTEAAATLRDRAG
jgi:integrase